MLTEFLVQLGPSHSKVRFPSSTTQDEKLLSLVGAAEATPGG